MGESEWPQHLVISKIESFLHPNEATISIRRIAFTTAGLTASEVKLQDAFLLHS
jgi:hypothetical protein